MFHLYLGLAYLYVVWRFVLVLPLGRPSKVLLSVMLLVASNYHLIQIVAFGTMFSPEMPRLAVVLAGWAFAAFVLLFVVTLLTDLVYWTLAVFKIPAKRLVTWPSRCLTAIAVMLLAGLGVYQAILVPQVRHVEVEIPELPASMDGLRVVHLTDLHISRLFQAPWVEEVVARTNALNPDLVLISGDLIDGTVAARKADVAPLDKLTAMLGVIAIPGNHEYYFNQGDWNAEFQRLGIQMLVNQHAVIGAGENALVIAGVADEAATRFAQPGPDLSKALANAPKTAPIILLKHRPAGAAQSAKAGVSLQLSGHTHGGMIIGLDQLVRSANEGFVSGLYRVANMQLYTSNGAGLWNGFPIRLGVPAEITEFTLHVQPR